MDCGPLANTEHARTRKRGARRCSIVQWPTPRDSIRRLADTKTRYRACTLSSYKTGGKRCSTYATMAENAHIPVAECEVICLLVGGHRQLEPLILLMSVRHRFSHPSIPLRAPGRSPATPLVVNFQRFEVPVSPKGSCVPN